MMEYEDNDDDYRQIAYDNCIEASNEDTNLTTIHEGIDEIIHRAKIERFVKKVMSTKRLAFDVKQNGELWLMPLSRYYSDMHMMLSAYDKRYEGTPEVNVFFKACYELGFLGQPTAQTFIYESPRAYCGTKRYAEWFNDLIERIRKLCSKGWYKKKIRQHERRRKKRLAAALQWEHRLFAGKSRHLMMFLTLGYKREYRDEVTLEQFQADLDHLLNNRRSNGLLNGIKEYVWHREEGNYTGLHVHILIAYDGGRKGDMSISKDICEYWEMVITRGKGHAHSANLYRRNRVKKGQVDCLGQVDQSHDITREAIRSEILPYLSKSDQLLKKKTSRFRTFGMSQPPEPSGKGRPRKKREIEREVPQHAKRGGNEIISQ